MQGLSRTERAAQFTQEQNYWCRGSKQLQRNRFYYCGCICTNGYIYYSTGLANANYFERVRDKTHRKQNQDALARVYTDSRLRIRKKHEHGVVGKVLWSRLSQLNGYYILSMWFFFLYIIMKWNCRTASQTTLYNYFWIWAPKQTTA